MRVDFTPEAENDVNDIVSHLLKTGTYAPIFVRDLDTAKDHLSRWPASGASRPDLASHPGVRFWCVTVWQVIYVVHEYQLTNLAVLHTSRNIRHELRRRLKQT